MDIKEHFEFSPVSKGEVFIKDCSLREFQKKCSQLEPLMQKLRSYLPNNYKFYLVDFVIQDCQPSQNTCRDIRWHFDGDFNKDNKYVLWVKGPNRTQFSTQTNFDPPEGRDAQNDYLEKILCDIEPITAPDSTIIGYDSKTPHRGVRCEESGRRFFIRMMASNYICPKRNKEENYAPLQ